MATFGIGNVVWVRMGNGDHEEPATVVELGCTTESGEEGVKCKLHVSFFETIFALDQVRVMPTGRPTRRGSRAVLRKVVTPSPTPVSHRDNKRKAIVSSEILNGKKKKAKLSTPLSPHFDKSRRPVKAETKSERAVVSEAVDSSEDESSVESKGVSAKVRKGKVMKRAKANQTTLDSKRKAALKTAYDDEEEDASDPDFSDDSTNADSDSDVRNDEILVISRKAAVKTKAPPVAKRKLPTKDDDESSEDVALVALKKPAGKGKKSDVSKSKAVAKQNPVVEVEPSVADEESESDTDRPYKVEYSPTGRATCRRCDETIPKGALRISHVPLFRGKPGYTVYRHLKCAVFSEEVACAEDVGGWRKLSLADYADLAQRVHESREEIKMENEELDPDELVPVSFQGEMRPPPPGLVAALLPFQVEGVSWMYHQEINGESGVRGGMLCDEMGMGKTIQTIVAILDNRPKLQHCMPGIKHQPDEKEERQAEEELWSKHKTEWEHEMKMNNVPTSILPKSSGKLAKGGFRGGTLVICPVIALSQWKTEIEKFTEANALTVGIYHGPDRARDMPREIMSKYDVVLTTYQVLEADFRKMTSPNKIKCPNCGGKFKIDKLRVHLKYFCGEGAVRTEAQARQRRNNDGSGRQGRSRGATGRGNGSSASQKGAAGKKDVPRKRMTKIADFDSECELSDVSSTLLSSGRLSRKASVAANARMSRSKKEWMIQKNDDSEEYELAGDSSSDDSSDDAGVTMKKVFPQARRGKKTLKRTSTVDDDSDDSDTDNSGGRKKVFTTKGKKGKTPVQAKAVIKKGSKQVTAKKDGKKKDDDSDDGASDDADPSDPMDGIDMDLLMKEAMDGSRMSLLHSLCWWRIVLDEAHFIKSRSSQTANAAFALISVNRWCLSGTPLQNRVGEFYSLIRFLRIDPMAHYFCRAKDCNCKSLHYRMLNGRCQDCGHGSVQHFSQFNKHVLNPIQRAGYAGDGRRAMFTLKREILDKCLLRRTKENRAADMKLPPRLVSIRAVRLHPIEEDFYNALYTQTQSSFNDYVEQGTLLNNYAHIFDLLMRMRQAVDHPYLVVYSNKDTKARASNGVAIANGTADCGICNEPPTDLVISSCCEAAFCRSCVEDYMAVDREGSIPCPGCRSPFSIDLNQPSYEKGVGQSNQAPNDPMPLLKDLANVPSGSILRRINLAEYATSTKIEALVEELVIMRETSPGSKAIVFSQFVNMLDLIRWRLHSDPCLKDMGLGARALHGGMDVKARDASLKDFRENPDVRVLLMSLKAGGVALNLTVANNIYLMDPWWNPAAEMQAIDRTHRLGQYRPIRAVRFIAEDTVEERILQLQEKKRLVFDGTIGRDAGSLKMLTVDDMKSLFA